MSTFIKIIKVALYGECNFCCLCLKTEQNIILHDEEEINIQFGEKDQEVSLCSVLQTIFGNEIQEYWSEFEKICQECLHTILGIYTFIRACQNNATLVKKALDALITSLNISKNVNKDSQSLFVSLNLQNFTSNATLDNKKLHSLTEASKRYQFLSTPKIQNSPDLIKSKKKKSDISSIRSEDMVYDLKDEIPRCKECLKSYTSLLNLRTHFLRVHAPKDFKCPKCPKAYSLPSLVSQHLSVDHCEIICSECGKVFSNRSAFSRHEFSHHLRLVCPDCGRVYKNNMTYKKHIEFNVCKQESRANPVDAQYTCDHCGKKYTQKMSLRVHIQYTHGNYKAHICKWCGKKFWAQSRLKAHIVKHTKEKNFTCSICQGKFVTKESLLYHTRLHTGEKPYRCSQCDCTFISSSRRAYHVRTYHLRPMVECETCHAKFASQSYLDKHRKSHKQCQNSDKVDSRKNKSNNKLDLEKKWNERRLDSITETENEVISVPETHKHRPSLEEAMSYVNSDQGYVFIETDLPNELIVKE